MTLQKSEEGFLAYLRLSEQEISDLNNLLHQNQEYLSDIDFTSTKVNIYSKADVDIVVYVSGGSGRNMAVSIETSEGNIMNKFRVGKKYYKTSIEDVSGVNAKPLELGINFQFSIFIFWGIC